MKTFRINTDHYRNCHIVHCWGGRKSVVGDGDAVCAPSLVVQGFSYHYQTTGGYGKGSWAFSWSLLFSCHPPLCVLVRHYWILYALRPLHPQGCYHVPCSPQVITMKDDAWSPASQIHKSNSWFSNCKFQDTYLYIYTRIFSILLNQELTNIIHWQSGITLLKYCLSFSTCLTRSTSSVI